MTPDPSFSALLLTHKLTGEDYARGDLRTAFDNCDGSIVPFDKDPYRYTHRYTKQIAFKTVFKPGDRVKSSWTAPPYQLVLIPEGIVVSSCETFMVILWTTGDPRDILLYWK